MNYFVFISFEGESIIFHLCIHSPKALQQLGLAPTRSLELNREPPHGWPWEVTCCPPHHPHEWKLNHCETRTWTRHCDTGYGHPKQHLNSSTKHLSWCWIIKGDTWDTASASSATVITPSNSWQLYPLSHRMRSSRKRRYWRTGTCLLEVKLPIMGKTSPKITTNFNRQLTVT